MHNFEQSNEQDFNVINIKLASPDKIREWSFGEVMRPETINYRTQRSERGGLFDEKIFGPEKDYECYCGKYRRIRYKNIVCERCGVEVTRSIVRRERMGHIELASPVAHVWFMKGIPSRIAMLLGISSSDLEKIVYFAGYIITDINEEERTTLLKELDKEFKIKTKSLSSEEEKKKLKDSFTNVKKEITSINKGVVLEEAIYNKYSLRYGSMFTAEIGAEAISNIFRKIDLEKLLQELQVVLEQSKTAGRLKVQKRINLVRNLIRSGVRPEWMFLEVIPIIPPALRPMVALDGGRHATSDVNDLYRRVINRNNRLKKLIDIGAPDVILRNEKRILQEAVDALIDNSIRHGTTGSAIRNQVNSRPLKSLADMLKGKQGRFRQNLLGKRVDYSGRSVIVVGPELSLDQCGLPKHMALELFRPFVISKILERELAFNIRGAGKLIEEGVSEVWGILEEVISGKYVLLNRAPTLHRLGIQAFRPVLVEGNAIRIHPLVCTAFNADFDGDQMAVHVPLTDEAQKESREIISAATNILKPGSGDPIVTPRMDIVLGTYWMTSIHAGAKGEGHIYTSPNAAIAAYDYLEIGFRAKIKIVGGESEKYAEFGTELFETTVGRILFNSVLPPDFRYINESVTGKLVGDLMGELIEKYGPERLPGILDKIKNFGFQYVSKSGITFGIDDLVIPGEKKEIVSAAEEKIEVIESNYQNGLISRDEKYRMKVSTWRGAWDAIQELVPKALGDENSLKFMVDSKARGSKGNLSQMSGMKGLIVNTANFTLDFPIVPSYKEGLSPIEYFVSTHGARKGLADTALNTAKAGYLTRRLVDVAQDAVILEDDCGDKNGRRMSIEDTTSDIEIGITHLIRGRIITDDLKDTDGNVLFLKGTLMTAGRAEDAGKYNNIVEARVRSPLTCKTRYGLCAACYGEDLGKSGLVKIGEAVGIVAAQAIGEPGTQLTMRTFHAGGVAGVGGDITMGLPRVEEIFEKRVPKSYAVINEFAGEILEIVDSKDGREKIIKVALDNPGDLKDGNGVSEYSVEPGRVAVVSVGDKVIPGDLLTDGSANISDLYRMGGKERTENYILDEITKVYALQGASISRKHVEVIIRQMFSRSRVRKPGDGKFTVGEIVENDMLASVNSKLKSEEKELVKAERLILGISEVSLTTSSWLSAASFQNTSRVLIETALKGGTDHLKGLKENVIIGRLIPAGTGFKSAKSEINISRAEEGEDSLAVSEDGVASSE